MISLEKIYPDSKDFDRLLSEILLEYPDYELFQYVPGLSTLSTTFFSRVILKKR